MLVNKYVLFVTVLILVLGFFLLPKVYYLNHFSRTSGTCKKLTTRVTANIKGRRSTAKYPLIEFEASAQTFSFIAPQYLSDYLYPNDTVTVLYNPSNPNDAYVLDHYGLWGKTLFYLIPFILAWTALSLQQGFFPKRFRIQIDSDKGFSFKKV